MSPIGNMYVIIRNKNNGPTSIKAFSLFFLSAFFRLISRGIPSDDNIFLTIIASDATRVTYVSSIGLSTIIHSVVNTILAIEAAF
jgi:hypothetical protein